MAIRELLRGHYLAAGDNDGAEGARVIKNGLAARTLGSYLTVVALANIPVYQLVRRHARLLVAQVLRHRVLF